MSVTPTDPSLIFKGVATITDDLPESSFARSCFTPFLDLDELDEALELHFAGKLDDVSPLRVNMPLCELVAGKPLISQLESCDIVKALNELPIEYSAVIRFCHEQQPLEFEGGVLGGLDYGESLAKLGQALIKVL